MNYEPMELVKPYKVFDRYNGGKGADGAYQKVINEVRPHTCWISLCMGNCAVSRNMSKNGAYRIGIDLDDRVIKKWRSVPNDFDELIIGCGIAYLTNTIFSLINSFDKIILYVDAPYLMASRNNGQRCYKKEMSDSDHVKLLESLLILSRIENEKIDVIVHHYPHTIYDSKLSEWRTIDYKTVTQGGRAVTERIYLSYENTKGFLHDYQFVGNNAKRRDKMKAKRQSFVGKLNGMEAKERNYLLSEILNKVENAEQLFKGML